MLTQGANVIRQAGGGWWGRTGISSTAAPAAAPRERVPAGRPLRAAAAQRRPGLMMSTMRMATSRTWVVEGVKVAGWPNTDCGTKGGGCAGAAWVRRRGGGPRWACRARGIQQQGGHTTTCPPLHRPPPAPPAQRPAPRRTSAACAAWAVPPATAGCCSGWPPGAPAGRRRSAEGVRMRRRVDAAAGLMLLGER